MKHIITKTLYSLIAIFTLGVIGSYANEPRLVINLVISSLGEHDFERFSDNFTDEGFRRLTEGGLNYTNAYYDFSHTSTAAGLATIATGAQPSAHGIVGAKWWNYVDGRAVDLIADSNGHPVPFSTGAPSVSPTRLIAPTIGDMLVTNNSDSKLYTVAVDPLSAIVLNGKAGVAYWVETNRTYWTSSKAYIEQLPTWIANYNNENTNNLYTLSRWTPLYSASRYHNSEVAVIEGIVDKPTTILSEVNLNLANSMHGKMCYTPAGNTMLLEFASSLIAHEQLGADEHTDILNICFDPARYIAETYGPESLEYEDMLYRLDSALAEFITYVYAQVSDPRDILIVLTSAHGTSPSYNPTNGTRRERLNTRQMEVIINAFLGAYYGSDDYILGFSNRAIYLNHAVLRAKQLDINAIREEVAIFVLQMRGIATAISASSLRNSSFGEGRTRLLQQSFYATRSGDVLIDLMPGWTIEDSSIRSSSVAGYNYDRNVPMVVYGAGIEPQRVTRKTNITEIAPTIAHILNIERPWASEEAPAIEIE